MAVVDENLSGASSVSGLAVEGGACEAGSAAGQGRERVDIPEQCAADGAIRDAIAAERDGDAQEGG